MSVVCGYVVCVMACECVYGCGVWLCGVCVMACECIVYDVMCGVRYKGAFDEAHGQLRTMCT